MSRMKGYIPKNIVFFARPKTTKRGHECEPAFPVADQSVERGLKVVGNAKRWARPFGRAHPTGNTNADGVTIPNKPQSGYRVVGAVQRGEGGRAWKVITPQGYLVDMREDVFLPILLSKGLPASGIIDGEFQWCQAGSQLRLELVGSAAHKEYTPAHMVATKKANMEAARKAKEKARRKTHIPIKDMVLGGVYEFEMYGNTFERVYVGRARFRGKLRTVWLPFTRYCRLSEKRPSSTQGWMDLYLRRCQRDNEPVDVILATGSTARKRVLHQTTVTLPVDWRNRKLRFRRSDNDIFDRVYDDFDARKDIEWT